MLKDFISYEEFKKIKIKCEKKRIPKILFRTSEFSIDQLPEPIINVLKSAKKMAPDYIQVYFDPKSRIKFFNENFPEYKKYYNILNPGAFKADLIRLLLVYLYGGIYCDIGYNFYFPFKTYIKESDELLLVKDLVDPDVDPTAVYGINNGLIGAYKNHLLIKNVIDRAIYNIHNKIHGEYCLDITGPMTLGRVFNTFFGRPEKTAVKKGSYTIQGYKIKMFYCVEGYIKYDRKRFIKTKFENYYKIMYGNLKIKGYCDIWYDHNVFKEKGPIVPKIKKSKK